MSDDKTKQKNKWSILGLLKLIYDVIVMIIKFFKIDKSDSDVNSQD